MIISRRFPLSGEKIIWRRLFVLLLFAVCIIMAGCDKKEKQQNNNIASQEQGGEAGTPGNASGSGMSEEDVQYIQPRMSLKGKEMLRSNNALAFVDTETGDMMYVCSIPGCTHSDREKCTALQYSSECPVLYNDRIYVFMKNDEGNAALYSLNIDGTDIREHCSFGEYSRESAFGCFGSVRVGDKLYFAVNYLKQEVDYDSRYVKTEFESLSLFEYDFTTDTSRELYKGEKGYSVGYGVQLYYSAGKLVLNYYLTKKSPEDIGYSIEEYMDLILNGRNEEFMDLLEQMEHTYYVYEIDIESGERKQYTGDGSVIGYQEGRLLLITDNENCGWYDMETGEITVVSEETCRKYRQLDGVIVIGTGDVHTEETYLLLFEGEEEPVKWTRTKNDLNFHIECAGDELLYIAWSPAGRDSSGEEWIFEFVDREEFLK